MALDKIAGPFVALWVIWIAVSAAADGWHGGLRAVLQGLVVWALIALVVWAANRGGSDPDQNRDR